MIERMDKAMVALQAAATARKLSAAGLRVAGQPFASAAGGEAG